MGIHSDIDAVGVYKVVGFLRRSQPVLLVGYALWYVIYLVLCVVHEGRSWDAVVDAWLQHGNYFAWTAYPIGLLFMIQTRDIRARFFSMVELLVKRRAIVWKSEGDPIIKFELKSNNPISWGSEEAKTKLKNIEESAIIFGVWVSFTLSSIVFSLIGLSLNNEITIFSNGESSRPGSFAHYFLLVFAFHLPLASILCLICGHRMGKMAYYGYVTFRHRHFSIYPNLLFAHEDRVLGFGPLGGFFVGTANKFWGLSAYVILWFLCFVCALYFEGFLIFMKYHRDLILPFGLLAFVVLMLQAMAAFLPLWTIRSRLVELKKELAKESIVRSRNRNKFYTLFFKGHNNDEIRRKIEILDIWLAEYASIPSWPVEKGKVRQFWIIWGAAAISILTAAFPLLLHLK